MFIRMCFVVLNYVRKVPSLVVMTGKLSHQVGGWLFPSVTQDLLSSMFWSSMLKGISRFYMLELRQLSIHLGLSRYKEREADGSATDIT